MLDGYELKKMPKYKAVSSHIGRRSYATNYNGLIDGELLRQQTGHKSLAQFQQYVGKTGTQKALTLGQKMKEVKEQMKLIKEAEKEPKLKVSKRA